MKKISVVFVVILITITGILAQTPEMFKYQAVLRDGGGIIKANETVTIDISILQSDLTTSVFYETHADIITTAQGLINLNIGSIENMNGVDWTADEYFIEITVNGTVMGASQLLSVPYAIQAKEVENVDYSQITNIPNLSVYLTSETDPLFTSWDKDYADLINPPDLSNYLTSETDPLFIAWDKDYADLINPPDLSNYLTSETDPLFTTWDKDYADIINTPNLSNYLTSETDPLFTAWDKDYADLTNKPTIDGSETSVTAGTNVTVTGTGTSGNPYVINATNGGSATYTIGLNADLGGYVFYVTADGKHGLVVASQDQSTGNDWYSADNLCNNPALHDANGQKFTDWRLPTIRELGLMEPYQAAIGISDNARWSSTAWDNSSAYIFNFPDGTPYVNGKIQDHWYVRAVRSF